MIQVVRSVPPHFIASFCILIISKQMFVSSAPTVAS